MAHRNNNNKFLTIPSHEGLFKTVRVERSGEDNGDDEEEEDTEEDVRLIPRCSPVPRKRGPSIADETAEYMRIRFSLPNRRVSFADTIGGDLVDVRMFVPFDSDEDESRWEEEEARYQKAYREPTYRVCPLFQTFTGTELMLNVHTNKLEVESVTSVPNEPLSFEVVIRVLNISFHKSVYVRSTMDGWITHFDYPAEYVQGSHDGETDKFNVKLSFASPYLFNGARIDFVVRYETSDGEFWGNNSGKNYSVTLLQSIEEDATQYDNTEETELRGILKAPRYRANHDDESYDDKEDDDLSSDNYESTENKTCFAQPTIVQPEIDIETAKNLSSSPESTAECHLSTTDSPYGEPLPLDSTLSNNSPQTESETADETVQPSTLHDPESTSELSEPQVHVFNVVPSTSLPSVFVHLFDDYYEFEDSNIPQKDDFRLGIAAQVPFEFAQPSFSDPPYFQEDDDLNEKKDVEEIDGTEVDVLEDQCPDIKEETETYFHVLEKSVQLDNNDHASEDIEHHSLTMAVDSLPEGLQHHLEKETEEQEVDLLSLVRAETTEVVEEMLTVESIRKGGEEIDDSVVSCLGVTTRQDVETHSSLIYPSAETSDHELPTMQEAPFMETGEDRDYIKQIILMSTSDHQTTVQGKSEPSDISEAPFIAPEFACDLQLSTVCSAVEEDLTCHKSCQGDEISGTAYQIYKDSEIKLPLPTESSKISTISKNETEGTLEKSMVASMTFFSAAVCLAVGIQEPSIFLVVGLLLLSLCF